MKRARPIDQPSAGMLVGAPHPDRCPTCRGTRAFRRTENGALTIWCARCEATAAAARAAAELQTLPERDERRVGQREWRPLSRCQQARCRKPVRAPGAWYCAEHSTPEAAKARSRRYYQRPDVKKRRREAERVRRKQPHRKAARRQHDAQRYRERNAEIIAAAARRSADARARDRRIRDALLNSARLNSPGVARAA